ncbi:MAG: ion transporter [Clostridia bacterium]
MSGKEIKHRELKEKVLEVLEGGLRGSTAARIFSIVLIVLIVLSMVFMIIADMERFKPYEEAFEIIETITIGIFTLELILGFWTADVRFEGHRHPRLRYLTDFMTIVQILAILPFYLGLILQNTQLSEVSEFFEMLKLLKLLHLLKIGEIGLHAAKERKAEKAEERAAASAENAEKTEEETGKTEKSEEKEQ